MGVLTFYLSVRGAVAQVRVYTLRERLHFYPPVASAEKMPFGLLISSTACNDDCFDYSESLVFLWFSTCIYYEHRSSLGLDRVS